MLVLRDVDFPFRANLPSLSVRRFFVSRSACSSVSSEISVPLRTVFLYVSCGVVLRFERDFRPFPYEVSLSFGVALSSLSFLGRTAPAVFLRGCSSCVPLPLAWVLSTVHLDSVPLSFVCRHEGFLVSSRRPSCCFTKAFSVIYEYHPFVLPASTGMCRKTLPFDVASVGDRFRCKAGAVQSLGCWIAYAGVPLAWRMLAAFPAPWHGVSAL